MQVKEVNRIIYPNFTWIGLPMTELVVSEVSLFSDLEIIDKIMENKTGFITVTGKDPSECTDLLINLQTLLSSKDPEQKYYFIFKTDARHDLTDFIKRGSSSIKSHILYDIIVSEINEDNINDYYMRISEVRPGDEVNFVVANETEITTAHNIIESLNLGLASLSPINIDMGFSKRIIDRLIKDKIRARFNSKLEI